MVAAGVRGPETRYHEAGHAVIARDIGWTVIRSQIFGFGNGETPSRPPEDDGEWYEDVAIDLAGPVAESRYLDEPTDFTRSAAANDREKAVATACEALGDDARAEAAVNAIQAQIEDALADVDRWQAVEAVADGLNRFRRLSREQVEALAPRRGLVIHPLSG